MAHTSLVQGTLEDVIAAILNAGERVEDAWDEIDLGIEDYKSGTVHFQRAGSIIAGRDPGPFAQAAVTPLVSLSATEQDGVKKLQAQLEQHGKRMRGPWLDRIMALVTLIKENPQLISLILSLFAAKK